MIDQMEIRGREQVGTKRFTRVPSELTMNENGVLEEFAVFVTFKKMQFDKDNNPHIEVFLNDQKFGILQQINNSPVEPNSRVAEIHIEGHRMHAGINSLTISARPKRGESKSQTFQVIEA